MAKKTKPAKKEEPNTFIEGTTTMVEKKEEVEN